MSYHNWLKYKWQNKLCEFENTTNIFLLLFLAPPFLKVRGLKPEVPTRFFVFFPLYLSILWDSLLFFTLANSKIAFDRR